MTRIQRKEHAAIGWNTSGRVSTKHLVNVNLAIGGDSILPNLLLVNSPKLVISFLYLLYNSLFTCMLARREWTQYAVKHAPLRGNQDSPTVSALRNYLDRARANQNQ
jgi:hypothetical protein